MATAHPLRRSAAALAAVLALGLVAGCGGSSDAGSDGPSTTAAPGDGATTTASAGETTTTTGAETTTTVADDGGGDLVGTWSADAQSILGANTANLGGTSLSCDGTITLEFTDGGTFAQSGQATCAIATQSATATIESAGDYEAADGTITISNATGSTTMEILGRTQDLGAGIPDGSAEYAIDGDTLSLTFTVASVGTVTQTYTRS